MMFKFGGHWMLGGVTSRATVTVNVQVARLVQSSVAVQTTVLVPSGKGLPDAGKQETATLVSALSVADGRGNETGVVDAVPQIQFVRLGGHWMTGGVVSRATVTVKVQTADSRQELVARHITVVVPRMNTPPDGGVQVSTAFVGQLPVVVGTEYVTMAVLATPQCQLVRLGGQLMRRGLDCWPTASATSRTSSGTRKRRRRHGFEAIALGQAQRSRFGAVPKGTPGEDGFFITSQWSWS